MALLSLAGVFVALYLYLHKLGIVGHLACGSGGCEAVQLSAYSRFLGLDVPLIGVGGYVTLLVVSVLALERPADNRWTALLRGLATVGVVFTVWLTYAEFFLIHAVCRWCLGSAAIISLICALAWIGVRREVSRPA